MFKKNNFQIIKSAITKEKAEFVFNYFNLYKDRITFLLNKKFIPFHDFLYGNWNDGQSKNAFCCYADPAMEVLLQECKSILEKKTKVKLLETYSYARIYQKGSELEKHTDRASCAISCTMNLGGDLWPIFLKDKKGKTHKVNLKQGDLLIYKGCELEHWREEFTGDNCTQVFLHYVEDNIENKKLKWDTRPGLGLPSDFKNKDV